MVTLQELAADWVQARAALKRQIKALEADPVLPHAGLSEEARKAIVARLKRAIGEYDALLKEYPNA
ncbi:MAG TPA: hypothetical protein VEJ16_09955 [Alphaproteobacteria bacterium]|nr:hypothetical protein [Alphaproteobacteria bacterium]